MFTVVILSEGARAIFEQSSVLFEPFVDDGDLAFCDWHALPGATTLAHALPGLSEAIDGHREWRAIVVDAEPDQAGGRGHTDPENPFDYILPNSLRPGESAESLSLEESPHPFVRLSHLLLGYPEMGVKRFEPVLTYVDPLTGDRVTKALDPLESRGTLDQSASDYRRALVTGHDVQIHYQEIPYSTEEQRQWADLTERYQMKHVRPSAVVFVATRPPAETDPTVALRKAWRVGDEQQPSRFVERNDYPASTRFAVYDLMNPERSGYDLDVMRFWLAVLCLAVNVLPPSAFQAERIYRIGVGVDEAVLGQVLNTHLGQLAAIRDHLDTVIHKPERPDETRVAKILEPQKIHLEFERLSGDELAVELTGYSMAADVPRNDMSRWRESFGTVQQRAEEFVRRPRRVLFRTVGESRAKAQSFLMGDYTPTDIERDEIATELARRLPALMSPTTTNILDRPRLEGILAASDAQITHGIHERMRRGTILFASAVVLVTWLAAFAPYLLQALSKGASDFTESALLTLIVVAVLFGVGLVTLVVQRRRLIRRMRQMNLDLRAFVAGVTNGAATIATFLSHMATYRYGRSVLVGAERKDRQARTRRQRRVTLRSRIIATMDAEKAIVKSLDLRLAIQPDRRGLMDFDIDDERAVDALFRLPIGKHQAEINNTGESTDAPYDFVTQLQIDRLPIHERDQLPVTEPPTEIPGIMNEDS